MRLLMEIRIKDSRDWTCRQQIELELECRTPVRSGNIFKKSDVKVHLFKVFKKFLKKVGSLQGETEPVEFEPASFKVFI